MSDTWVRNAVHRPRRPRSRCRSPSAMAPSEKFRGRNSSQAPGSSHRPLEHAGQRRETARPSGLPADDVPHSGQPQRTGRGCLRPEPVRRHRGRSPGAGLRLVNSPRRSFPTPGRAAAPCAESPCRSSGHHPEGTARPRPPAGTQSVVRPHHCSGESSAPGTVTSASTSKRPAGTSWSCSDRREAAVRRRHLVRRTPRLRRIRGRCTRPAGQKAPVRAFRLLLRSSPQQPAVAR